MTPEDASALLKVATDHHRATQFEQAILLYRQLLDQDDESQELLTYLASALRSAGRQQEAVPIYDRLESLAGDRADFWLNRGNVLSDLERHQDAADCYARAMEIEPHAASIIANYAIALARLGRESEAEVLYRRALEIDPDQKLAVHNLGNLLADRGHLHEAASLLRRTVRLWPDLAEGHYNLGLVLLRLGDFANGLRGYEWRWQTSGFFKKPGYRDMPIWQGESLAGKTLVVHSEQGLGDTIQFSMLLGLVKSLGGDVIFHVPERLDALMSSLPFDIGVTAQHKASAGDYQIPLMSLMHRLGLTLGSIPACRSYLSAPPGLLASWRERLGLDGVLPTIGLVWQGNPNSPAERGRSLASAEQLAAFSFPGIRLLALQKLDRDLIEEAETASGWRVRGLSFELEHPGPDLDGGADAFLDTAAIMTSLDLVVSVCTAPLHLAGALGRPTLALLRTVPDWRWGLKGEDTPWYPSMTLCRQRVGEDYMPVIERAAAKARARLRP